MISLVSRDCRKVVHGQFSTKMEDMFGTVNFITPEVVEVAAREVTQGISVSLK